MILRSSASARTYSAAVAATSSETPARPSVRDWCSSLSAAVRSVIAPRLAELPLMLWAARTNFSISPAARLWCSSARRSGVTFEVESLEAFGRHLAAHGLKYSDGPHLKESGGGFAFIDAPEGYEVELIQVGKQPGTGGY